MKSNLVSLLFVFIGGGLGSLARFGMSALFSGVMVQFPLATLLSNVFSSLVLGFAAQKLISHPGMENWLSLLIITGFCGGFSTFSAFSNQNFLLLKNGSFFLFGLNTALSIILSLAAIVMGMWGARHL